MANRPKDEGETIPVQGETQDRVPKLPHERDESASSQSAQEPSARSMGRIASDDLASGKVDTDKGPALDRAYDKVREGADDPVKKKRP